VVDETVDDGAGQARHLGQQAVAARRDSAVQRVAAGQAEDLGRGGRVDQLGRGERLQLGEQLLGALGALAARQVVADDELTLGVDAGDELLELQREQTAESVEATSSRRIL